MLKNLSSLPVFTFFAGLAQLDRSSNAASVPLAEKDWQGKISCFCPEKIASISVLTIRAGIFEALNCRH